MLEGKELEGNIGNVASYSVDIDDKGFVEVKLGAGAVAEKGIEGGAYIKADILVLLEKLADKTATPIDNGMIQQLRQSLGR